MMCENLGYLWREGRVGRISGVCEKLDKFNSNRVKMTSCHNFDPVSTTSLKEDVVDEYTLHDGGRLVL